jgi:foldase protein PrsA
MNKNAKKGLCTLAVATLLLTGCGKEAKLDDDKTAVKLDGIKITATDYYNEIKETNISKLVEMIDHQLFDEEYPATDEEDEDVKSQIDQIKESYSDEATFNSVIQQYFGVSTEDELEDLLRLEYKRNEAVVDHIEDDLTKEEIEKYYDENIIGDIKASHILITPDTTEDASSEEQQEAEEKALRKANRIVEKLDNGEDFAELAKQYSDDEATKDNGGDLGYFNTDDMDENFMDAVKELKKNEYTGNPVKTEYGYHIILKTDQKDKPKLKKVRSQVKEDLANEKLDNDSTLHYQTLMDIREEKGIKWNDDELKKQYEEYMDQLLDSAGTN